MTKKSQEHLLRLKAFSYFQQKIKAGHEGAFFSLDRPMVGDSEWVFGWGQKIKVKEPSDRFPVFEVHDWTGLNSHYWHFENSLQSSCLTVSEKNSLEKISIKKADSMMNFSRLKLKKKLQDYMTETEASFVRKVKAIQDFQSAGNAWVMNFTQNIEGLLASDLKDNNERTRKALLTGSFYRFLLSGASHCGGVVITNDQKFCSFSPEVFIHQRGNQIKTFPIKGTGTHEKLSESSKERSELAMVTDLLRNDFGQICDKVVVEKERILTKEASFYHAQSVISGILKNENFYRKDFLRLLPAGSISGAPKKRVTDKIKTLESFSRQFYTGSFGVRFSPNRSIFNLLIRTLFLGEKYWYFPVGAGITIDSEAIEEYKETGDKARVFEQFCCS